MRHVLRALILSPNAYVGLEPCFARKKTMLAGYEGSMLCSCVRPAYGRTFSRPPAGGRATCCSEQVSLQALQSFVLKGVG